MRALSETRQGLPASVTSSSVAPGSPWVKAGQLSVRSEHGSQQAEALSHSLRPCFCAMLEALRPQRWDVLCRGTPREGGSQ